MLIIFAGLWFSIPSVWSAEAASPDQSTTIVLTYQDFLNTVKRTTGLCEAAIGGHANMSSAGGSDSIAAAAAAQSVSSSSQATYMRDAVDYCNVQKERCEIWQKTPKTDDPNAQKGSVTIPVGNVDKCKEILARGHLPASLACDASPLILRMTSTPLVLSPPLAGIRFDILGGLASPPHAPQNISWFLPQDLADTYFIVLPDAQGRINGIDQMFGNNTAGPDHAYATNGFEALAKYDGRRDDGSLVSEFKDGKLDQNDPIFHKLRLWHDLNGNGIAEPNELVSLDEVGLASLDLGATAFLETDAFGNSLRKRSIASLEDGSFRLVFDLWFALND